MATTFTLMLLTGCQAVGFYQQAILGQTNLLRNRESTEVLLASVEADPALKHRIELVNEILAFADDHGLPSAGAYRSYVETGQQFVIWNVFATMPFELSLKTSCFPIAGCVTYRGYFKKSDANRFARTMAGRGYDVYVGGVAAYSTLGWFDDPLLDTFLFRPEEQLAALLFHELSHQLAYVKNDTRFNESVATTVEQYFLKNWLQQKGELNRFNRYLESQDRRKMVLVLINNTRLQLKELYSSDKPRDQMLTEKQQIFAQLVERYEQTIATWTDGQEFQGWMSGPLNNAKLETVADYNQWVPGLSQLLKGHGFVEFKLALKRLGALSLEDRETALGNL